MDPYAAQTYPPPPSSQIQPPTQDPYLYNQPQPYTYYPPQIPQQQYPNPNPVHPQPAEQEPAPIHPPGVPVQTDPNQVAAYQQGYVQPQPHFQNDPYYQQQQQPQQLSYPDAGVVHQGPQQWQPQVQTAEYGLTALYPPNGQGGRGGGSRGGFRGGRGRGRGRFGKITTEPKPRAMAWCELCRVDCNTLEILENHRNGKKHKKNLKIQEDLQKIAARTTQESLIPIPPAPEPESEQSNPGLKRKKRESVEQQQSVKKQNKEIVPFICELCNVKCESGPTFDSHLKGKKHGFNLQRFQEQQASLGQAALQALYPALEALYPALLQALAQNTANNASSSATPLDQQVLQWLQAYLPQTGPAVLPQGPGPVPGPEYPVLGPGFGAEGPTQECGTQVEDVKEGESKIEEKVGPESGTGEVELKVADPDPEPEAKPEQEQKQELEGK
ncbi:hypothetical protein LXL04_026875 [Taraxacum kok-saghyz]